MDISFKTPEGRFNYRVCGVIIRNERLLAMQDGKSPYSYLPGGRVKLGENAEEAILREIREEMHAEARILRPLWFCQSHFIEDTSRERFHEICIYYLLDLPGIPDSDFAIMEKGRLNRFEWIPFGELKERYLYPDFIKDRVWNLPEGFEILTDARI